MTSNWGRVEQTLLHFMCTALLVRLDELMFCLFLTYLCSIILKVYSKSATAVFALGLWQCHTYPSEIRHIQYLRVRLHHKKEKTFNRVFLAQELEGAGPQLKAAERRISTSSALNQNGEKTGKAIWALVFSKDGRYLAAAGQDRKVRVWAVISTPEEREDISGEEEKTPVDAQEVPQLSAPVFQKKPIRVYEGHTGSILDLSWSKVRVK